MIELQNISFSYNSKGIFDSASLAVKKGDFVFLVGESGIGKTTLLKLLYFDILPDSGNIRIDEYESKSIDKTDIPKLRRKTGIIFQDFKLMYDRNVFENISLPLQISGEKNEIINKKVLEVAEKTGLVDRLKEMPYDISGGEQQRAAIARAIINNPLFVLSDEPTGNLDPFIANDIINLLIKINNGGTTVIVATHNFDIVRKHSDKRIVQIKDKKLFDVRIKE